MRHSGMNDDLTTGVSARGPACAGGVREFGVLFGPVNASNAQIAPFVLFPVSWFGRSFPRQPLRRALAGRRHGRLLRPLGPLLWRHVLRRLLAAHFAIFLAQALQVGERFWRDSISHAAIIAPNSGKECVYLQRITKRTCVPSSTTRPAGPHPREHLPTAIKDSTRRRARGYHPHQ
jgi:hypothetical protein